MFVRSLLHDTIGIVARHVNGTIHVPAMNGLNIRGSLAPNFVWRIVRAHSSARTKFTAKTGSMFSPFMAGTCTGSRVHCLCHCSRGNWDGSWEGRGILGVAFFLRINFPAILFLGLFFTFTFLGMV